MIRSTLLALILASIFSRVTSWPETAYAMFAVSLLSIAIGVVIGTERQANRESELRVIGRDVEVPRAVAKATVVRRGPWEAWRS